MPRRAFVAAPFLAAAALLCLVPAACGGHGGSAGIGVPGALGRTGGTSGGAIRPFSLVEVGKTRLQFAGDGRSVIVQLETNPPTVCAIAYGRTAALGSIADDPDMGGTAISEHTVVLAGLAPGATYQYRLTATDAQGLVFQTPDLASFTTPRPAKGEQRDVAIGAKVIAVSSQWSDAYKAANAVDGNLSTEWSSDGDGDRAFITIDLGREYKITGVAFITREMSDGSAITKTFAVVVDGHRRYGPFPAGNRLDPHTAQVRFTGRRLRFEVVTSTGGNTGAAEVEAFSPN
ncbi:MAG TPA: discoidin domain-containing protein [Acidimicrobiales bacterium]|nr:discoidin domain-containing protein [Acidimicrobiales bacterium]